MKLYMVDTDVCSYILKKKPPQVFQKFATLHMDQICISVITYAELLYGVERLPSSKITKSVVDAFVQHLTVAQWTCEAAHQYAKIRTHMESTGNPIGNMDLLIAAHAQSLGATIVTNNTKHFARVPNVTCENWV